MSADIKIAERVFELFCLSFVVVPRKCLEECRLAEAPWSQEQVLIAGLFVEYFDISGLISCDDLGKLGKSPESRSTGRKKHRSVGLLQPSSVRRERHGKHLLCPCRRLP
jgi:hypothetical protein